MADDGSNGNGGNGGESGNYGSGGNSGQGGYDGFGSSGSAGENIDPGILVSPDADYKNPDPGISVSPDYGGWKPENSDWTSRNWDMSKGYMDYSTARLNQWVWGQMAAAGLGPDPMSQTSGVTGKPAATLITPVGTGTQETARGTPQSGLSEKAAPPADESRGQGQQLQAPANQESELNKPQINGNATSTANQERNQKAEVTQDAAGQGASGQLATREGNKALLNKLTKPALPQGNGAENGQGDSLKATLESIYPQIPSQSPGLPPSGKAWLQIRPLAIDGFKSTTAGPLYHSRFLYSDKNDSGYFDSGYYDDSKVREDQNSELASKYKTVGPPLDADLLRKAEELAKPFFDKKSPDDGVVPYKGLTKNCHDYASVVLSHYEKLLQERQSQQNNSDPNAYGYDTEKLKELMEIMRSGG